MSRQHIVGIGIDEWLMTRRSDGTTYWYLQNGLGSVMAVTAGDGVLLETVEYDVYGAPTVVQHNGALPTHNRFLFTGREYDYETELYWYRARHYHPVLGRFLQRDPLKQIGAFGFEVGYYEYARNIPNRNVDPYGLWSYPLADTHDNCSKEQGDCIDSLLDCISEGFNEGLEHAELWYKYVDDPTVFTREVAKTFSAFKVRLHDKAAMTVLVTNLRFMDKYFRGPEWEFECHCFNGACRPGVVAYARLWDDEVNLCPPFFLKAMGIYRHYSGLVCASHVNVCDYLAGVVLHEISHIAVGTKDYAYYFQKAKYQGLQQEKRLWNADCYAEYFWQFLNCGEKCKQVCRRITCVPCSTR